MSHRIEIYRLVSNKWKENPKLKLMFFRLGKTREDVDSPKTAFFQRLGGSVADTTTKSYMEEIPYAFESFARTETAIDELVEEIEETFDRASFSVEGKTVVWMTRTAPTLVEEVGSETFRSFAMYNVRANLERR